MTNPLPQEFPRSLVLLGLEDVLPDLNETAQITYRSAFEVRRTDPLTPRGLLLTGAEGLRPLMAMMRLVALGLRDLNLQRFPEAGSQGQLVSAYAKGANLSLTFARPVNALFIERADQIPSALAQSLDLLSCPLYATWEGPCDGPIWSLLAARCDSIETGR